VISSYDHKACNKIKIDIISILEDWYCMQMFKNVEKGQLFSQNPCHNYWPGKVTINYDAG
jgi:hypothetical protein